MRRWTLLALTLVPVISTACLKGVCEQTGVPGVQIAVRDADGVAQADSAFAVLSDVTYRDTMKVIQIEGGRGLVLAGAVDRSGVYNLCIHKTGFADYIKNDIVVPQTACGIEPVQFLAILAPASDSANVC